MAEKLKRATHLSRHDEQILKSLSLLIKPRKKSHMQSVKWNPPASGWLKLNVDGTSLGNPGLSGARGAIRDSRDELIAGFAIFTATSTNNFAEFMGLLQGLRIARFLGLQQVEIEMDFMVVFDWIRKRRCGLWYLEDYWKELL